jgi:hypothetical protein
MKSIQKDEIVFCLTYKQFHPSHVTVADPDSSDSSLLYPTFVRAIKSRRFRWAGHIARMEEGVLSKF